MRWACIFIAGYVLACAALGLLIEGLKVIVRHLYHNRNELKIIGKGALGIAVVVTVIELALWLQAVGIRRAQ